MPPQSLPLDIHLIVLSLLSSDKIDLSNAALTCKAWTPCAHSFLFHSIILDTKKDTILDLSLLCEKNPDLLDYFKILTLPSVPSLHKKKSPPFSPPTDVIEKPLQDVLLNTSRDAFCRVRSLSLDGLEEIPVAFLAGFPSLTTLELYRLGQRPVSFDHRASFPPRNIALVALYIGDKHLAQAAWLFPLVSATLCSLSLDISSFNSVDKISLEQLSGLQHLHHLESFSLYGFRPLPDPLLDTTTRALQFLSPNAPLRNLKFASEYFDPLISTPEMWAGIAKEVVKRNTQIHLEFSAYETDRTTFSPEWLVLVTKWFHEESLREVSENGLLGQVDVIRLDDECTLGADSLFD